MATALRLDFTKLGLDDYDATCKALNFPAEWPDGLIVHGSTEVYGRLRLLEMWGSRQHFDRFVESRLQSHGPGAGRSRRGPANHRDGVHTVYTRG